MPDRDHIVAAIAAQEGLRGVVPDEIVDAAVTALRRRLAELDGTATRRRQITVLFADVSGFTALAETLDAEVLAGTMNDLWRRLDAVVEAFGGRVDKHMGDAVMALWGAETVREDDVERAVRAGLALQEALATFREQSGSGLSMRVGINTGHALVGAVGSTAEQTAMGDTVNLASRLEHLATVGSVLVSHDTYRHVRGVFDVEELAPMQVRGKAEQVRAYVVLRAKPRAFRIPSRGVEGIETPTVGRDAELLRLRTEYAAAIDGAARLVLVVGDAGVGKSRLLFELESWIEARPESVWLLQGRALANRQGVAHGLVRDLLAERFGVLDSDAPADVAAKLTAGFAGALGAAEASTLGHWLGFDLGDAMPAVGADGVAATARAHLARWLGMLASRGPIVILLEDLHWADVESLALVDDLVVRLSAAPLLVVGLTRPDLVERHPSWFVDESSVTRVELAPLSLDASAELARRILHLLDAVPDQLVEFISQRCDGNPFFVEELVKMFVDDRVIRTDAPDGRWTIDVERLAAHRVPATLTGVLQARLDNLGTHELASLQRASVVGRVFWDASVRALEESATSEAVRASLDEARARELVFRRARSVFEGADEFIFKHALLRDVTYETVLLRDRTRLHSRAAAWLTAAAGDRLVEYLDTIAQHHRLADEPGKAADLFHQAATSDLRRGLAGSARRSLELAVELWTVAGVDVPCEAHVALGEALRRIGDFDAAGHALAAARAGVATPGERVAVLHAASALAGERGDPIGERALLDEAAALADASPTPMRIRVTQALAWWELGHGDIAEARRYAEAALVLSEGTADRAGVLAVNNVLAAIAESVHDYDRAEDHARTCRRLAREIGDLHGEATAIGRLGILAHLRGDAHGSLDDYVRAAATYESAAALYRELGYPVIVAVCDSNLAQACLRLGDRGRGRAALRRATTDLARLGARGPLLLCVLVAADWRLTDGDVAPGLRLLGLVRAHPASTRNDHDEIRRILSRTSIDADTAERGMTAGADLDVDEVVAELIAELIAEGSLGAHVAPT